MTTMLAPAKPLTPPLAKARPQFTPSERAAISKAVERELGKPKGQTDTAAKPVLSTTPVDKPKTKKARGWQCRVCGAQGGRALYPPVGWYRIIRQGEGNRCDLYVAVCPGAGCLTEYLRWVERDRAYDLAHPKEPVLPVA